MTVSPGKMRSGLPERRPPRFSWMSSFQYGAIRPLDRVTPPSARWLAAMVQRLSPRWTVYRSGRPGGAAPSLRAELSGTGATGGTWAAGGMDATALAEMRELEARAFASEDLRGGLAAFAEKRAPRFEGH